MRALFTQKKKKHAHSNENHLKPRRERILTQQNLYASVSEWCLCGIITIIIMIVLVCVCIILFRVFFIERLSHYLCMLQSYFIFVHFCIRKLYCEPKRKNKILTAPSITLTEEEKKYDVNFCSLLSSFFRFVCALNCLSYACN